MPFSSSRTIACVSLALLLSACQSDSDTTPETGALTTPPQITNGVPPVGTLSINSEIGGLITRLSDSATRPSTGSGLNFIKTDYSRIQAENADASELLVYAVNDDSQIQFALLSPTGGTARPITLPAGNASGYLTCTMKLKRDGTLPTLIASVLFRVKIPIWGV